MKWDKEYTLQKIEELINNLPDGVEIREPVIVHEYGAQSAELIIEFKNKYKSQEAMEDFAEEAHTAFGVDEIGIMS